jgi:glycosyltransferase involved in cell wall biosynthesis
MKISIILPVFNVSLYLADCLNSLMDQDLTKDEYEVICVDDGSTDNSVDIINKYIDQYNNIKIISKENGGVSSARNLGIRNAKGKYIWFIDPDDFILKNSLSFIVKNLELHNAEIIRIECTSVPEFTTYESEYTKYTIELNSPLREGLSACFFIVSKELLVNNNISFCENLNYGEDYLWALNVRLASKRYIQTFDKIYNYRQRSNSAMNLNSKNQIRRHLDSMLILAEEYNQIIHLKNLTLIDLKTLQESRDLAIQYVLFDALRLPLNEKESVLLFDNLKSKKLYPYSIMWRHVVPNTSLNHTIINWVTLFLPVQLYFKFLHKIIILKNK